MNPLTRADAQFTANLLTLLHFEFAGGDFHIEGFPWVGLETGARRVRRWVGTYECGGRQLRCAGDGRSKQC